MTQSFQVNLRGVIELLSSHLYSGPQVFIRELLQNAVDATTSRMAALGDLSSEEARIAVSLRHGDSAPEIRFQDRGIGLTEEEVHQFLATVGESSKRRVGGEADPNLLGQFGIGLLACFLVSEDIVVRTRSARSKASPCVEWRGRQDGTYEVQVFPGGTEPFGTTVSLKARADREEWFEPSRVRALLEHFGSLLRFPIELHGQHGEGNAAVINPAPPPWRSKTTEPGALDAAVLAYGSKHFETPFLDWIPLRSTASATDGIAFVLPTPASLAEGTTHAVYLKGMLVTDRSRQILPAWAFFVRAIVDSEKLRPTASRESLYEDALLDRTQEELGLCIRAWLLHLAKTDATRLVRLVGVHHRAIKALAADDDDVLELFVDVLPFETTQGKLTFAEIRTATPMIRFAAHIDVFRQMAPVATAQGTLLVNAGYAYDREVLQRAAALAGLDCAELDTASLTDDLDDPSPRDQDAAEELLRIADAALEPFGCDTSIKQFRPAELPALYASSADAELRREMSRVREKATGGIWDAVLGAIQTSKPADRPLLCFNLHNLWCGSC